MGTPTKVATQRGLYMDSTTLFRTRFCNSQFHLLLQPRLDFEAGPPRA